MIVYNNSEDFIKYFEKIKEMNLQIIKESKRNNIVYPKA